VARFPKKFGWIHRFDALQSVQNAMQTRFHPVPPHA
jgi:hypothetical protein